MGKQLSYRGRFAPSPTGPLHFGSLIAATASYLQAKQQHGEWLVRIDDIDPPREQAGAAKHILKTLEGFGFEWDKEVFYQSQQQQRYQEIIDELISQKNAYPCSCSRKSILEKIEHTAKGAEIIYPGFCRKAPLKKHSKYSIRLRSNSIPIIFTDALQGKQSCNLEKCVGDFILKRKDQLFSYQLATAIDDAEQNISEVVRGTDLLSSTPSQIYIQQKLKLPHPKYCHLPLAINKQGQKLSKQNFAPPLKTNDAVPLLYKTLKFLGQMPPIQLADSSLDDIWRWAILHWQRDRVPKQHAAINNEYES